MTLQPRRRHGFRRSCRIDSGFSKQEGLFLSKWGGSGGGGDQGGTAVPIQRVLRSGGAVDAPAQYPYPYKIISRYQSWHGSASGASSASGDPRRWFQEPLTVPGVVFAPDANPYRPHFDSVEQHLNYVEFLIEQEGGRNKVAAFLLEPIVGSNGIIVPPDGYLEGIRDICDRGIC